MKKRTVFTFVLSSLSMMALLASCGAGAKGEKGDKGDPGEPGAPGQPGAPGKDGEDGEDARVEPFTVTFDSNGGSAVDAVEMDHIGRVAEPEAPKKDFYVFDYWATEDGVEWIFSKDVVAEDTTLVAQWSLDPEYGHLESSVLIETDPKDSPFTVWTGSDWVGHVKRTTTSGASDEWAAATINMNWRTVAVFDGEGALAYAVSMPANGYGGPHGTNYTRDVKYADYTHNPAIVLGDTFETDKTDWELRIPEGGFAVTAHTDGANELAKILTNGKVTEINDSTVPGFNKAPTVEKASTFVFDNLGNVLHGYYKKHYLSLEGTVSDFDVEADEDGEYTVSATLAQWNRFNLHYGDTLLTLDNTTFVGAVVPTAGGADWTDRLYDEDGSGTFLRCESGSVKYIVTYNPEDEVVSVAIDDKFGTILRSNNAFTVFDMADGVADIELELAAWKGFNGATFVKNGKAVYCQYNAFQLNNTEAQNIYIANDSDPVGQLLTNAAGTFQFTINVNDMTIVAVKKA